MRHAVAYIRKNHANLKAVTEAIALPLAIHEVSVKNELPNGGSQFEVNTSFIGPR